MSNKLEIIKKCEYCGKRFVAQRTTTRYCSHTCNSKAYKEDKRKKKVVAINYAVMQEIERISERFEEIRDKEFLSVVETAFLLSIERTTVYRYLHRGQLKGIRMDGKTFIRRSDIDAMFDNAQEYQSKAKPSTEAKPLTEFYTVAEIKEKFNIKESWLYKITRENNIPKTLIRGKSYFSKKHIDKYFEKKGFNENQNIDEWYTVADIMKKYDLSLNAIYSFVSENQIPKKKDGRMVLYSKYDFDVAKGYEKPRELEYYSVEEALEKYNLTRDALYHYIKYHNIPKIKDGRYIKISKPELDKLFNPEIIQ
ncbi:helix-turn-helix domain-containing protein [Dysgonomonas sp. Marseille-P4677]|uniref:helix-turn-helix domain-containing protein n=1 Tax=Dysgonomonas sp. Marseille-P4677 TaxID=2364790 RepID=UPI001912D771|nr:helix-turn-helix domain-containing protein [Dysgonomonas sp. Marseille-P4677]MBK5719881.1 helix-turn-helix domain-containing protein [Dysgonomonas sp. Marseille-P4677]